MEFMTFFLLSKFKINLRILFPKLLNLLIFFILFITTVFKRRFFLHLDNFIKIQVCEQWEMNGLVFACNRG